MPDDELRLLAENAAKGDDESFAALCGAMKLRLYRTAVGMLGDQTLALDAVSEAVFRAYKGIRKLKQPQYASTWFTKILLNCAKDIARKRRNETPSEIIPEEGRSDGESDMYFDEMIKKLPGKAREIVSLKYFSGYTLKEISEILSVPVGTVKSRLGRALADLRLEAERELNE